MDTPATPSTSGPPQNAFQRRYSAWAAPYYARMAPTLRHEVECLDRWLYSRAGLKLWLMLSGAIALTTIALVATGTRWSLALPATATGAVAILLVSLGAWLQPERYTSRKVLRFFGSALVLACLSALCPVIVIHVSEGGTFDAAYVAHLRDLFVHKAMPLLLLLVVVVLVVAWSVAAIRRFQMQRELVGVRLVQERDAVARQLAEARLQLLQGQIQPHFIFNTLAAVQHWVDSADPRAGPLLRALSSFLRGSTELLTQERTTFGVEVEVVRHYLAIMEARLGDRLRHADCDRRTRRVTAVAAGRVADAGGERDRTRHRARAARRDASRSPPRRTAERGRCGRDEGRAWRTACDRRHRPAQLSRAVAGHVRPERVAVARKACDGTHRRDDPHRARMRRSMSGEARTRRDRR